MRSVSLMVVLASMTVLGAFGCGGGGEERRPARAPVSTTKTTSAALTTKTTSTTVPSTNATMTPSATLPPAPPPRPTVSTASAVVRMTTARCDREEECSNVGTGKEFGDRDSCVNEIGHDVVSGFSSDDCPGGVDADSLAACVAQVKIAPCLSGGKADERAPASCTREQLCKAPF